MELSPNILKFIELAGGNPANYSNPLFFTELIVNPFSRKRTVDEDETLVDYVRHNPELLVVQMKGQHIFDYFFGKALHAALVDYDRWFQVLVEMIILLHKNIINCENSALTLGSVDIFNDRTYIYRLQGSIFNHNELFKFMVAAGFELGDEIFLVNSIISRGEIEKLKILEPVINIADTAPDRFPFVFATALRYGRHGIIRYLRFQLKLDVSRFGKILDLEHYEDNPKYMFYRPFAAINQNVDTAVIGLRQNYQDAFARILDCYHHPISLSTLDIWAEIARIKVYQWDQLYFKEVFELLQPLMTERIPITHDFGEFNVDVFGREWTDRVCLVEHCLQLESRINELEAHNTVLRSGHDTLCIATVDELEMGLL